MILKLNSLWMWLFVRRPKLNSLWIWLSWRLPRKLVYWCAIRVGAEATTGKYGSQEVPALTFMDAIDRW